MSGLNSVVNDIWLGISVEDEDGKIALDNASKASLALWFAAACLGTANGEIACSSTNCSLFSEVGFKIVEANFDGSSQGIIKTAFKDDEIVLSSESFECSIAITSAVRTLAFAKYRLDGVLLGTDSGRVIKSLAVELAISEKLLRALLKSSSLILG